MPRWLELEMEINESVQCISEFTVDKVFIWCVAYYTLTYISYDVTRAVAMVVATVMDRGVRSNPVQSLEVEKHDTIMESVIGGFTHC